MKTLRFTLSLSLLLVAVCMTVNAQKQRFAYESTEDGLGNINKIEQTPSKIKKRTEVRSSTTPANAKLKKAEILKIAEKVIQAEESMIIYANYYFDSNNVLKARSKYTYDDNDNLVEYNHEILNDYSKNWMSWREKWIVSNRYTQTFDTRNNIIEYVEWELDFEYGQMNVVQRYTQKFDEMNRRVFIESYSWDDNFGMLVGDEKYLIKFDSEGSQVYSEYYMWDNGRMNWVGDYKEIYEIESSGGITNYELYGWSFDSEDWFGRTKYTSTYVVDGINILEEQFFWSWNQGSRMWEKDLLHKNEYSYQIFNVVYWYVLRTANYELINSEYVLMDETTRVPYPQGNSYLSTLRKVRINDVLTDYIKTEYQYNENNKWSQVLFYAWLDSQWQNSEYRVFEYSTPDSVRTQINKRSAVYYQFNGLALPNLCQGESLYPTTKYVTKYHPITGNEECYYTYRWDNGYCNWVPNSNKRLTVYDASWNKELSYTECNSYDQNDWYNCWNRQTVYNEAGQITERSEYQDGILLNKSVNVFDNQGNRISLQYYIGDSLVYRYDSEFNTAGRIVKQIYNFFDNELPLGKERYKWEVEYIADTIISVINHFYGDDLNEDGLLDDEEWHYNGKTVYKYDAPLSGDSVHIVTQAYGDLEMIDFGTIKKLKITGPVKNSELYVINSSYQDFLRYLDLETAQIEFNTLGEETFEDTRLNTIILPNTLENIQEGAIYDYEGFLEDLVIYPSVKNFEDGGIVAFGLRRVELPSMYFDKLYSFMYEEMSIPGIVNVYRSKIEKLTFNDTHGKLPNEICYNMAYLKNVEIKDGITEIGDNAFKSCGMLSAVKLPSTLTKIGYNAFWGCNELTELVIPEGTSDIGYSAFWGCSGISSIEMPASLLNIGKNAFWGCTNVEQLRVAAVDPPALGDNALAGIPRDASLTIPEISVETYKTRAQWKEFYNVNTGTKDNRIESLKIAVSGRQLLLSDVPENTTLQIYNVSGLKILEMVNPDQQVSVDLVPGIYILKVGNGISKIVIR
jgi:hypothetical protein